MTKDAVMVQKWISGAQTGVDRAALDAALYLGYEIGGYVPKGRIAEDGVVPSKYPMRELESSDYKVRTAKNIAASGATIILIQNFRDMRGGTLLTKRLVAEAQHCVGIVINMESPGASTTLRSFWDYLTQRMDDAAVSIVNWAGSRESKSPGIYRMAYEFIIMNIPARIPRWTPPSSTA